MSENVQVYGNGYDNWYKSAGALIANRQQPRQTFCWYNPISVSMSFTEPESHETDLEAPHSLPAKRLDSVPMLDLQRQYAQVRAEVLAAVECVCASQQYILGPEVEALERELADFCGARDAVGCASGTDALWLALAAAGVRPGDQVLTTPFSFFASASAIARAGARPVFADIDPCTFNLDPAQAEFLLRGSRHDRLRALLPVHLYGQCADMDALERLAGQFRLCLIEDAAQAIGAAWRDRRAGHWRGVSRAARRIAGAVWLPQLLPLEKPGRHGGWRDAHHQR